MRNEAVRVAARGDNHAVKVIGPKASTKAKGVVKDAYPGEAVIRHDLHIPGGDTHWQPKKSRGGQVGYEIGMFVLGLVPVIGWAADAEAANADEDAVMDAIRNRIDSAARRDYGKPFQMLTREEQAKVWAGITTEPLPQRKRERDPKCSRDDCPEGHHRWMW